MAKRLYSASGEHKVEAGVKDDIRKWLIAHRIYDMRHIKSAGDTLGFFYMPVPGGFGLTGVSDFIICFQGRTIALETKAENKPAKPTSDQKDFMLAIEEAGGLAVCVNSLETFISWWQENVA
jgi:hypothetical protein